jgi:elongator complex protein 5
MSSNVLFDHPRPDQPFIIIQSSAAQSSIPILRQLVTRNFQTSGKAHTLLFCLLYPPSLFFGDTTSGHESLEVHDYVGNVPGYADNFSDPREDILLALSNGEY